MQVGAAAAQSAWGAFPGIRNRVEGSFAAAAGAADEARQQEYAEYLRSKYGAHFRVESIPNNPEALERAGKAMHGDDVVIAPNIVAEMARDPEVASWYEGVIDSCFATVPQDKAYFASIGLTFEPCGVVVHEDGTVTYICGGGDTPERVAQVNAINAARDAKRAANRRAILRASQEHAEQKRALDARLVAAQAAQMQAAAALHTRTQYSAGEAALAQVPPAVPTPKLQIF